MEIESTEDFHLHSSSLRNLREFLRSLKEEEERLGCSFKRKLCICNHHFMFDFNILKSLSNFFKYHLIPGFGIETRENIHVNIIEPNRKDLELLKEITSDRENWLLCVLEEIQDMGFPIDPYSLLKKKHKSIQQVTVEDLCEELCDNKYDFNVFSSTEAEIDIVSPIIRRFPYDYISFLELKRRMDEQTKCLLCNPEEIPDLDTFLEENTFHGILVNPDEEPGEHVAIAKSKFMSIYKGTNRNV